MEMKDTINYWEDDFTEIDDVLDSSRLFKMGDQDDDDSYDDDDDMAD